MKNYVKKQLHKMNGVVKMDLIFPKEKINYSIWIPFLLSHGFYKKNVL